jgi:hypothetical protein
MTRTERSVYPNALIKDRSVARNGLEKTLKKSGDGAHNWGNPLHDYQNEPDLADQDDLKADTEGEGLPPVDSAAEPASAGDADAKGVDIKGPERKMSMTDEEREKAREFRHGALKNDHVNLADIARTSGGVSHSPTMESTLSTSPVRNMNTLAKNLSKY